jgi:tripartite-type tricarboxylate transporter receptor subunit TctC
MRRKNIALLSRLAIAGAAFFSTFAWAQATYPNQPVKIVVPFNPGGTTDFLVRLISPGLSAKLGQPVIVENRAGANSIIGTNAAAKSPPDGHTLVIGTSAMVLNHAFSKNGAGLQLPYDSQKDLSGVAMLAQTPYLLLVHADSDIKNVQDLVKKAKANPGAVSYGSAGSGGSPHLAGILLGKSSGTDLLHVPFKGSGPAMLAVLGKQVDFTYATYTAAKPQVDAGKLRIIAVAAPNRLDFLPGVPTLVEQGVKGADVDTWFGLLTTNGTPDNIREKVAEYVDAVLSKPEMAKQIADIGAERPPMTAAQFDAFYQKDLAHWEKMLSDFDGKIE